VSPPTITEKGIQKANQITAKKNRGGDTISYSLRATEDLWFVLEMLCEEKRSIKAVLEEAIDEIYHLVGSVSVNPGKRGQIVQCCLHARLMEDGNPNKRQRSTRLSSLHIGRLDEVKKAIGIERRDIVLGGISILRRKRGPELEIPPHKRKTLIRLLERPLVSSAIRVCKSGEARPPLWMAPKNMPVLLDASLIYYAILGKERTFESRPVSFSKAANLFLKERADAGTETMLSALELPRLIEYLRKTPVLESFYSDAEWEEGKDSHPLAQLPTDLEIILKAVLDSFIRIVTVSEDICVKTAYSYARQQDKTVMDASAPQQSASDSFLQFLSAQDLHPAGFVIATASDAFDHLAPSVRVFKPME